MIFFCNIATISNVNKPVLVHQYVFENSTGGSFDGFNHVGNYTFIKAHNNNSFFKCQLLMLCEPDLWPRDCLAKKGWKIYLAKLQLSR